MKMYYTVIAALCLCVNIIMLNEGCAQTGQEHTELLDTNCIREIGREKGYTFKLLGCERTGKTVVCHLEITSQDRKRELSILSSAGKKKTRISDQDGESYRTTNIKNGIHSDPGRIERKFFADKPATISISFGKVPEAVGKIVELELVSYDKETDSLIEFTVSNISFCGRK